MTNDFRAESQAVIPTPPPCPPTDFQILFASTPGLYLALLPTPEFTIVAASEAYLRATMTRREAILGRGIFDVFPDNPATVHALGLRNLRASLERVRRERVPDTMPVQKYDLQRPAQEGGRFEERYCKPLNTPVLGADGQLRYILHQLEDVTQWVQLSAQSESRRMSAQLTEQVSEYAIFMLDPAGNVMSWNVGAERLKGYKAEEVIGKHFSLFYTRQDVESGKPARELAQATSQGHVEDEGWRVRKDGSRFWANVVITRIQERDGHLAGFAKVTRDLTERKRTEDLLRQWKHIFEHAEWGIVMGGAVSRRLEMMNPAFARMHGYTVEELTGAPLTQVFAPSAQADLPGHLQLVHQLGHHVFEAEHLRKDGTVFPVLVDATAVKDETGRVLYRAVHVRDLTEQKRQEARVRSTEARVIRRQKFLADVGQALSESLDLEIVFKKLAELAVPYMADWCVVDLLVEKDELRRIAVAHADPAKEGLTAEFQRRYKRISGSGAGVLRSIKTGSALLVSSLTEAQVRGSFEPESVDLALLLGMRSYMIVPLQARGRIFGAMSFVAAHRNFDESDLAFSQEVASRMAVAVDNARLYQEAQKSVRARQDTIAIVSHDLKNPLNAIRLNSQVLRRLMQKLEGIPPELRQKAERLVASTERAALQGARLISDLLDFGKMESGTFTVSKSPVDVHGLLQESVETLRPLAAARNITLEDASEAGRFTLCCDHDRVIQVLSNLVGNAIKFTPERGRILVRADSYKGGARFSVSDTGRGIPRAVLPHIFERYWQPEESRRQGAGLGLSIAKGIVEAHGGSIWAESPHGAGTTFFFTLPDGEGSQPEAPRRQEGPSTLAGPTP